MIQIVRQIIIRACLCFIALGAYETKANTQTGVERWTVSTSTRGTRTHDAAPRRYRNLFVEILGKTQAETNAKLEQAFQQLFHGTRSDQPIYYELAGGTQAQIMDVANNDVRSEGQSYGMVIAVQMDKQAEFDKLWAYASTCMQQPSGMFSWLMTPGSCHAISTKVAPDGDEYFAMAMVLASRRWGKSRSGVDYGIEARKILSALANTENGEFNADPPIVTFGPGMQFSDPSYVLPLFYSEWARFDPANRTFWESATTYARTHFSKVCNPNTGLAPYLANFDGTVRNSAFNADAWRVPMNIMMDYNLNHADPWQDTYAKTHAAYWAKNGIGSGAGMIGINAMLAFALPPADAKPFLQAAWGAATPTGKYRYYSGCLYLLSMLHLSGRFDLFE